MIDANKQLLISFENTRSREVISLANKKSTANLIGPLIHVSVVDVASKQNILSCKMQQFLLSQSYEAILLLLKHLQTQRNSNKSNHSECWNLITKYVIAFYTGVPDYNNKPLCSYRLDKIKAVLDMGNLEQVAASKYKDMKMVVSDLLQLPIEQWLTHQETSHSLFPLQAVDGAFKPNLIQNESSDESEQNIIKDSDQEFKNHKPIYPVQLTQKIIFDSPFETIDYARFNMGLFDINNFNKRNNEIEKQIVQQIGAAVNDQDMDPEILQAIMDAQGSMGIAVRQNQNNENNGADLAKAAKDKAVLKFKHSKAYLLKTISFNHMLVGLEEQIKDSRKSFRERLSTEKFTNRYFEFIYPKKKFIYPENMNPFGCQFESVDLLNQFRTFLAQTGKFSSTTESFERNKSKYGNDFDYRPSLKDFDVSQQDQIKAAVKQLKKEKEQKVKQLPANVARNLSASKQVFVGNKIDTKVKQLFRISATVQDCGKDLDYVKLNYVQIRLKEIPGYQQQQLNFCIYFALEAESYLRRECSQGIYRFEGSPFFTSKNHRLMNYPHSFMFKQDSWVIREFQSRQKNGVFNIEVTFKSSHRKCEVEYHYMDELMGLLAILNDGVMYVERRTFAMLLSALMRTEISQIIDPLYLNPIHFPFTQVLSWLVFDNKLRNFNVSLFYDSNEDLNIVDPDQISNFGIQYIKNIKMFKHLLRGKNSVIVEFIYLDQHNDIPRSRFVVVRKSADPFLFSFSCHSKSVKTIPQSATRNTQTYFIPYMIHEMINELEFNRGQKKVIRVKMYACQMLKKMPANYSLDYTDFIYTARNFFVRFFSMYSALDFPYAISDMYQGFTFMKLQSDMWTYEDASDADYQSDPEEYKCYRAHQLPKLAKRIENLFDYISKLKEAHGNKKYFDTDNKVVDYLTGAAANPEVLIQSYLHCIEMLKVLNDKPESLLRSFKRENIRNMYNIIVQYVGEIMKAMKAVGPQYAGFLGLLNDKKYQDFFMDKLTNLERMNYQLPADLKQAMAQLQNYTLISAGPSVISKPSKAKILKCQRYEHPDMLRHLNGCGPLQNDPLPPEESAHDLLKNNYIYIYTQYYKKVADIYNNNPDKPHIKRDPLPQTFTKFDTNDNYEYISKIAYKREKEFMKQQYTSPYVTQASTNDHSIKDQKDQQQENKAQPIQQQQQQPLQSAAMNNSLQQTQQQVNLQNAFKSNNSHYTNQNQSNSIFDQQFMQQVVYPYSQATQYNPMSQIHTPYAATPQYYGDYDYRMADMSNSNTPQYNHGQNDELQQRESQRMSTFYIQRGKQKSKELHKLNNKEKDVTFLTQQNNLGNQQNIADKDSILQNKQNPDFNESQFGKGNQQSNIIDDQNLSGQFGQNVQTSQHNSVPMFGASANQQNQQVITEEEMLARNDYFDEDEIMDILEHEGNGAQAANNNTVQTNNQITGQNQGLFNQNQGTAQVHQNANPFQLSDSNRNPSLFQSNTGLTGYSGQVVSKSSNQQSLQQKITSRVSSVMNQNQTSLPQFYGGGNSRSHNQNNYQNYQEDQQNLQKNHPLGGIFGNYFAYNNQNLMRTSGYPNLNDPLFNQQLFTKTNLSSMLAISADPRKQLPQTTQTQSVAAIQDKDQQKQSEEQKVPTEQMAQQQQVQNVQIEQIVQDQQQQQQLDQEQLLNQQQLYGQKEQALQQQLLESAQATNQQQSTNVVQNSQNNQQIEGNQQPEQQIEINAEVINTAIKDKRLSQQSFGNHVNDEEQKIPSPPKAADFIEMLHDQNHNLGNDQEDEDSEELFQNLTDLQKFEAQREVQEKKRQQKKLLPTKSRPNYNDPNYETDKQKDKLHQLEEELRKRDQKSKKKSSKKNDTLNKSKRAKEESDQSTNMQSPIVGGENQQDNRRSPSVKSKSLKEPKQQNLDDMFQHDEKIQKVAGKKKGGGGGNSDKAIGRGKKRVINLGPNINSNGQPEVESEVDEENDNTNKNLRRSNRLNSQNK